MHLSSPPWLRLLSVLGGGSIDVDFLFIVTSIAGVCNCSMFCCTLLYVHSSIAIISMGKRELVALLCLSSWCLMMVEWLFLVVTLGCLRFVIKVFPDHAHLLFFMRTGIHPLDSKAINKASLIPAEVFCVSSECDKRNLNIETNESK